MEDRIAALAERATEELYRRDPSLVDKFGEKGKRKCLEDNLHHVKQLDTAGKLQNGQFFTDYAVWLNGILLKHGMETAHLVENFRVIDELIEEEDRSASTWKSFLGRAIEVLQEKPETGGGSI